MRLLILLGVLLLFNLSFEMIDEGLPARDWWLFDDGEYGLTPEWYWHEVQRRATVAISFFLLAYYVNHNRREILLFALIQGLDFVDWILTNSTPWFKLGVIPISMNIVATSIWGILIFMTWIRTRELN